MTSYPTVKIAQAVNASGNRGDHTLWRWINASMRTDKTWEQLGDVPSELRALDQKLAHGQPGQLPPGPPRTKVNSALQDSADHGAAPLTGVILRLALEDFKLTEDFNVHFSNNDLGIQRWYGDSHQQRSMKHQ